MARDKNKKMAKLDVEIQDLKDRLYELEQQRRDLIAEQREAEFGSDSRVYVSREKSKKQKQASGIRDVLDKILPHLQIAGSVIMLVSVLMASNKYANQNDTTINNVNGSSVIVSNFDTVEFPSVKITSGGIIDELESLPPKQPPKSDMGISSGGTHSELDGIPDINIIVGNDDPVIENEEEIAIILPDLEAGMMDPVTVTISAEEMFVLYDNSGNVAGIINNDPDNEKGMGGR